MRGIPQGLAGLIAVLLSCYQPSSHKNFLELPYLLSDKFSLLLYEQLDNHPIMVNVAIAGGTGGVGRTILEILNESPKHKAFVLSRKVLQNTTGPRSAEEIEV